MSIGLESKRFETISSVDYYNPRRERVKAVRTVRYKVGRECLMNTCNRCELGWCPIIDLLKERPRQKQTRIEAMIKKLDDGRFLLTMQFASKDLAEQRELLAKAECVQLVDSYEELVFAEDDAAFVAIGTDD